MTAPVQAAASPPQAAAPKTGVREILTRPRMLVLLALGAASGFPNQVTESALQAWLKDLHISNTDIGVLSYVSLPYLLKFLWAPLLDRFPLPLLGRRRGWILATQLLLAATIALLAFQDPAVSLLAVSVCATAIVFFSASQDIVIDAYRTDLAEPAERGLAAASASLGYRAASWIAFAVALVVADNFGWPPALLVVAAIMAAFAIVTIRAPEPVYPARLPQSLRESVVEPLRELAGSRGALSLLGLVMIFKLGDAFAVKLFTPFLMDVGFSKTEIGLVAKAVFTSSSIVGAVLGGIWMVRLGLFSSMLLFGLLQAVSNLAYYVLAIIGKNFAVMIAAVAIENLTHAMGNVAMVALIMALCDTRFSAFQYALLSVLAQLPRYGLGGPAGWVADHGGWPLYYVVSFLLGIPGLVTVWLLRDRIRALDMPH
ncbi:MAG TPA: MFS transporter [Burkholderiaceae bacterium]|jgi:PAT family beta-lactamase induction signal transducer AmpG|nr:MFS transporter [Burkholderiaceae bacterium]